MEEVLDTYALPYDPDYPVVCLDEKSVQLLEHVREPLPPAPGCTAKVDYEYKRCGTANLFIEFEPLTGQRIVTVTDRRTSADYVARLQALEQRYPEAEKIRLIQDQLSTHSPAALYDTLPPEEANRLKKRFEWIYTPKHASWLNIAEMEWAVVQRQCIDRHIATKEQLEAEIAAWERDRNEKAVKVNWQFTTETARGKKARYYSEGK